MNTTGVLRQGQEHGQEIKSINISNTHSQFSSIKSCKAENDFHPIQVLQTANDFKDFILRVVCFHARGEIKFAFSGERASEIALLHRR